MLLSNGTIINGNLNTHSSASNYGHSSTIEALAGVVLWSYESSRAFESSPALGDVDGDGKLEIVIGGHDYEIYALDGENGIPLWSHGKNLFLSACNCISTGLFLSLNWGELLKANTSNWNVFLPVMLVGTLIFK